MLFNSWIFAFLCSTTFFTYYGLPRLFPAHAFGAQLGTLLVASMFFYGSHKPELLLLLLFVIFLNSVTSYFACFSPGRRSWIWAAIGVAGNLLVLAGFKYNALILRSFFSVRRGDEGSVTEMLLSIPLPIGISFFTFQGISLVVDSFRSRGEGGTGVGIRPGFLQHLIRISVFKAFFPQLIAGPIVKAHDFLPQMREKRLSEIRWNLAGKELILGYFFKMVVADNLKDQTFWLTFPYFQGLSTLTLITLLFGYSFQIFSDFAGYSLIAIGLARLFGYNFPGNFHFPYISRSFSEFWTRWHISLSSWLREYLYIPLGGNRGGNAKTYLNLMIVMGLGGLWHGATWSYAIWGLWHGLMLAAERFLGANAPPQRPAGLRSIPRILFIFISVTIAWLLFKLPHFDHVLAYARSLAANTAIPHTKKILFNVFVFSFPPILYHIYYLGTQQGLRLPERWKGFALGLLLFFLIFQSGAPGEFIYFQF